MNPSKRPHRLLKQWILPTVLGCFKKEKQPPQRPVVQIVQILQFPNEENQFAYVQLSDGYNYLNAILSEKCIQNFESSNQKRTLAKLKGALVGLVEYTFWVNKKATNFYMHVDKINFVGAEDSFPYGEPSHISLDENIMSLLATMRSDLDKLDENSSYSVDSQEPSQAEDFTSPVVVKEMIEAMSVQLDPPIQDDTINPVISYSQLLDADDVDIPNSQQNLLSTLPGWQLSINTTKTTNKQSSGSDISNSNDIKTSLITTTITTTTTTTTTSILNSPDDRSTDEDFYEDQEILELEEPVTATSESSGHPTAEYTSANSAMKSPQSPLLLNSTTSTVNELTPSPLKYPIYTQQLEESQSQVDSFVDNDLNTQNKDYISSESEEESFFTQKKDADEEEEDKTKNGSEESEDSEEEAENTIEYLSSPTILRTGTQEEEIAPKSSYVTQSPTIVETPSTPNMKKRKLKEKDDLALLAKHWKDRPIVVNWKSWL